jgi:hypothetical protein
MAVGREMDAVAGKSKRCNQLANLVNGERGAQRIGEEFALIGGGAGRVRVDDFL